MQRIDRNATDMRDLLLKSFRVPGKTSAGSDSVINSSMLFQNIHNLSGHRKIGIPVVDIVELVGPEY
jgi:hypothetical protein